MKLSSLYTRSINKLGLQTKDVKQGLVMFLGCVILFAIISPDAFLSAVGATGSFAAVTLVMWSIVCPINTGLSVAMLPLLTIGFLLAAVNYSITVAIGHAATGGAFEPGLAKGLSMGLTSTAIVGIYHVIRLRFRALNVPAMLGQQMASILVYLAYFKDTVVPGKVAGLLALFIFLPVVVGGLVAAFIVPTPAGVQIQQVIPILMGLMGKVQQSMNVFFYSDEEEGAGEEEKEGETTTTKNDTKDDDNDESSLCIGIAKRHEADTMLAINLDRKIFQLFTLMDKLAPLASLEVNVYRRPHRFPKASYRQLFNSLKLAQQICMMNISLIQAGKGSVEAPLEFREHLKSVTDATSSCCLVLGAIFSRDQPFSDALPAIKTFEETSRSFQQYMASAFGFKTVNSQSNSTYSQALALRCVGNVSIYSGYSLRTAFKPVPKCIAVTSTEVTEAVQERGLEGQHNSNSNSGSSEGKGETDAPPPRIIIDSDNGNNTKQHQEPPTSPPVSSLKQQQQEQQQQKQEIEIVRCVPNISNLRHRLFRCGQVTGLRAWHWKLVLHMCIMYAIAVVFCSLPSLYHDLDEESIWIFIAVFAINDITSGSTIDNGLQRIGGTVVASVWVFLTVGLGYVANGNSFYGTCTAKVVVEAALVSVWMGVLHVMASKYGLRYNKFFSIAKMTVPLLSLTDFRETGEWKLVGFRIGVNILTVAVDTLLHIILFPVSTVDHVRETTVNALTKMSTYSELTVRRMVSTQEELTSDNMKRSVFLPQQKLMGSLAGDLTCVIDTRDAMEREWLAKRLTKGVVDAVGRGCVRSRREGFGARYTYCTEQKLDPLIFYANHCFLPFALASAVQEIQYVEKEGWERSEKWAPTLQGMGEQYREALRALQLVLLGALPMERYVFFFFFCLKFFTLTHPIILSFFVLLQCVDHAGCFGWNDFWCKSRDGGRNSGCNHHHHINHYR